LLVVWAAAREDGVLTAVCGLRVVLLGDKNAPPKLLWLRLLLGVFAGEFSTLLLLLLLIPRALRCEACTLARRAACVWYCGSDKRCAYNTRYKQREVEREREGDEKGHNDPITRIHISQFKTRHICVV
jgi:hypothetical protein